MDRRFNVIIGNIAYNIINKEKLEQYHKHPEKDTHPKFFYMRDIVKAYESLDS